MYLKNYIQQAVTSPLEEVLNQCQNPQSIEAFSAKVKKDDEMKLMGMHGYDNYSSLHVLLEHLGYIKVSGGMIRLSREGMVKLGISEKR